MPDNLKDFNIEGPDGHSYTVTASPDATDEQLIGFVQQNLGQTPATPTPIPAPNSTPVTQNVYVQGNPTVKDEDWLGPDARAQVTAMQNNPKFSYGDIDKYVKSVAKQKGLVEVGLGGTPEQLDAYRKGLTKGNAPQDASYAPFDWGKVLGSETHPLAPGSSLTPSLDGTAPVGLLSPQEYSQLARGAEEGAQYMGAGFIGRTLADWAGVGNETIDALYPNATPEQRDQLRKSFLAWTQRGVREANAQQTAGDNPLMNLGGQALVPDLIDAVGGIGGGAVKGATALTRVAKRVGEGTLLNAGMDAAYQGLDVKAGVSDEYNPMQTLEQAALGGALHGGMHGVHEATGGSHTPTEPSVSEPIRVPTAPDKRSKAYKSQLTDTVNGVVDHINKITKNWTNAPEIEVHPNFKDIPGLHKGAIAAITDEGKVVINTAKVLERAKRLGVAPEDVVSAAVYHESLGHHGLQQVFREDLDRTMESLYDNGPDSFKRTVDKFMKDNPQYSGKDITVNEAVEEVLAKRTETEGPLSRSIEDKLRDMLKNWGRKIGLDLKYSSREIRSILAQAHEATIHGVPQGVGSHNTKLMQTGLHGNQALNERGFYDAPPSYHDAVERAQAGEAAGPGSEVHKDTGWFFGPDRRWRTEIDDSQARIDVDKFFSLSEKIKAGVTRRYRESGKTFPLGEVLNHPALYDLYPDLAKVKVTRESPLFDLFSSQQGSFHPGTQTINITPYAKDPEGTLLHEVQHWVQDHEGFSPGGTPQSALKNIPSKKLQEIASKVESYYSKELDKLELKTEALRAAASDPLFNAYAKAHRAFRETYSLKPSDPRAKAAYHARNAAEDAIRMKYFGTTRSRDIPKRDFQQLLELLRHMQSDSAHVEMAGLHQEGDRLRELVTGLRRTRDNPEELRKLLAREEHLPFQAYQHLFGEVEARDTTNRRKLTANQRRETAPYTSEGFVEPNDYIFDHGMGSRDNKSPKYMMDDYNPKTDKLSADDLFESQNALDILKRLTDNYKPAHFTMDELRAEAERRNVPLSSLKGIDPGDLTKRLFMHDIVGEKLNERVTKLYNKLNTADFSVKDRDNFTSSILKYEELSGQIFDIQGEAGRTLRAVREMQLTLKKIKGVQRILGQFTAHNPIENLQDPEVFRRFADDVMEQLNAEQKGKTRSKLATGVANALNLPRALMSSVDLSAPLRQGIFLIGRKEFYTSFKSMFRMFGSEDAYNELLHNITHRNTYPLMRDAGLSLTSLSGNKLTTREEAFMSHWAEKIPVVGRAVKASERAYTGFLDKLRADVFDSLVAKADKAGVPMTEDLLKSIGKYINNATGRGDLGGLTSSAPLLNSMFFSPRLIASRAQLLNPVYYAKQPAFVRKEMMHDLLSFGALAMTVIGLAKAAGMQVQPDPRSSDFGKIRLGNTRWDILGGFGQYIVLGSRLTTNQYTNSKGETKKYGTKYGQSTRLDALGTFARNKLAPVPSFVADYLAGKDSVGQKFDPATGVGKRFIPLFMQDYYSMVQENGAVKGSAMAAPGLFGVGLQNYDSDANAQTQAETVEAPESFSMKSAPDFDNGKIKIESGTVNLSPEAQKLWKQAEDTYMKDLMQKVVATKKWKTLNAKQRLLVTKEAKAEAYKATKNDILPQLVGGNNSEDGN